MMRIKRTAAIILSLSIFFGCSKIETDPTPQPDNPEQPTVKPEKPSWPEGEQGKSYIWNSDIIPEICVEISQSNWNALLTYHDINRDLSPYVKCDIAFSRSNAADTVRASGMRIRDNIDGMRPEGSVNEAHSNTGAKWGLCNFELDFNHYDSDNSLRNVQGMLLRSCVNDPTFARERFCSYLLDRFGIWTVSRNRYCRLSIHVEGDQAPAYLGVYQMVESVDQQYLNDRRSEFGRSEGFLWECSEGAFLKSGETGIGADNGKAEKRQYLLMNNQDKLATAKAQLNDFIKNLNTLKENEFQSWITSVMDVELFLRTYAAITTTGMYDDYWNTGNNYFLFFNSYDPARYKVFFIPGNFEKSLGNNEIGSFQDPGVQSPYQWGKSSSPLISRILNNKDFRQIYTNALYELTLPEAYLFNMEESRHVIKDLMNEAGRYTKNDTGLCMQPYDRTAQWSTNKKYNLTEMNEYNFFKVRSEAIQNYLR